MTAMDDLVTWLRAQLDNDERMARAADVKQGDPDWRVSPVVITRGEHFTVRSVRDARPIARVQRLDGDEGEPAAILDGAAVAEHIANWDPARVLADVAAKRRLLDDLLATPHHLNDREWYGCRSMREGEIDRPDAPTGQPCTCGRDEAVRRRTRLLALPYADRPGYRAEWAPDTP